MLRTLITAGTALTLMACSGAQDAAEKAKDIAVDTTTDMAEKAGDVMKSGVDGAKLTAVLAAQPAEVKARYEARNPKATLDFFGIAPGMTVVEALPGGGWYTKILMPYLGTDGKVIGADYALDMWPHFGGFATEEFLEKKKTWPATWTEQATGWGIENAANVAAFAFGSRDTSLDGTADAALFIRAMHNLNRFADKGDYMGAALSDVHALLKPGGTLGIVQHRSPEDNDAAWANGSNGYLKQSDVIAKVEAAGFELIESSEINANPKDTPTTEDIVWRLPPSLGTSRDNEELKAEMMAIGESDRMTLKFRKK